MWNNFIIFILDSYDEYNCYCYNNNNIVFMYKFNSWSKEEDFF